MRIIYGILIVAVCLAVFIGVSQWRGPVLVAQKIKYMPLELRIVASGEVRYQSVARIGSEITGTVIARHVREGDLVNEGDLLLELSPGELQSRLAQAQSMLQQLQQVSRPQAQTALIEAKDNLRQASREARRREQLVKRGVISIEQVEQAQRVELNAKTALTRAQLSAEAMAVGSTEEQLLQQRVISAEAELAKTRIYAPFAGQVQTRNVEPGDLVQPSDVLLEIARRDGNDRSGELSNGLEVVVALDEKNFAPVQLQQPVELIADAWPEQIVPGVVSFIAPAVDSARGTIDVHIDVLLEPEKHKTFLQGMTVSANIIAARRSNTLILPNDYLQRTGSGLMQALRWQEGKVTAVDVELGLRNMTHSEVVSGLREGDIVVQTDAVIDGQRARIRIEQAQHVIH